MPRPTQPILSRELIFRTALESLDRSGRFTIPEIAQQLGVSMSSLYHHVKGRADIVEGIRGLMADWELAPVDATWQEAVAEWARRYRDSFAEHPGAIPELVSQTISDKSSLDKYETLATILAGAGFDARSIVVAASMIDALCLGSALELGAPAQIWARSDQPDSVMQNAIDAAGFTGNERADAAFELHLAIVVKGLAATLG